MSDRAIPTPTADPPRVIALWAPVFGSFGGGIAAFNRDLALALPENATVHLAGKHDSTGSWRGLPLWGAGNVTARLRTLWFAGGIIASSLRRRPTLIVCGHVHFSPLALALRRCLGIPYVTVAFGVEVGTRLSTMPVKSLRNAKEVWAISRWTRQRVIECGVAPERVRVLPVTFAEDRFTPGPRSAALVERYSIRADEKVVLTVARLDSREGYKGCDRVMHALPSISRLLGPVRYVIVGEGDDLPRLRRLAGEIGVDRQVVFAGFVEDADLPDYYRLADAFAMPSLAEGFGIVFLEAMACGTPCLGGNVDGTVDALADGALGLLVDPTSSEAIGSGLIALLERQGPPHWFDPVELRRRCLARHGRNRFRSSVREAYVRVLQETP